MKNIYFLFISLIIISCNNNKPEILWNEAKLMRTNNRMRECIINLETIIINYPEHDLAAKAQFQKAEIYLNDIKDYDIAIEEFEKVINQFASHDVVKKSLFMIAYIYNNYLSSYSKAIDIYKLFIIKYPNDELIPSVKYELEGLFGIEAIIDSLNTIVNQKENI